MTAGSGLRGVQAGQQGGRGAGDAVQQQESGGEGIGGGAAALTLLQVGAQRGVNAPGLPRQAIQHRLEGGRQV